MNPPEHDLVFTSEVGTVIDPKNFFRILQVQSKKIGLPKLTLHAFRHLHSSFLIARGVNIKTISDRLGHASAGFTLHQYSQQLREYRDRSAFTVEQILSPDDLE